MILTRAVTGATPDHFTFPTQPGVLNLITAIGSTPQIAYHKARTAGSITILPTEASGCVCVPTPLEYVIYMDTVTDSFSTYCDDEPRSDMLRHGDGTGRNVSNMACHVNTYHGGLRCCQNGWFLTDRDQDSLIPPDVDTYYLKWRYYFQEYVPPTTIAQTKTSMAITSAPSATPASHKHLHHWVFLIDNAVNDYEEDNADYSKASMGKITAHLDGSMIGLEDTPTNYSKITFYVMTAHCHAPNCVREELWNTDTNELICSITANYGDEKYGDTKMPFNEANYIAIPPCIWGYQPGLLPPPSITADTNLTAIKYFNNTYRHLGQMAQWTGLMTYDTDEY